MQTAAYYTRGLLQHHKKRNMERIAEIIPVSQQVLQQFLTDSPWDHRGVFDQVLGVADKEIGDPENAAFVIDDTAFDKKGNASAGVARQYNGNLGKVDNCQIGVYGALVNGRDAYLTDSRLYLNEEWTKDKTRCDKVKIPMQERVFKTKDQIACEIIKNALSRDARFKCVLVDGGYGKNIGFLLDIEALGKYYLADVHKDQYVYLNDPKFAVPAYGGRGRIPTKKETTETPIEVSRYVASQSPASWIPLTLRKGTKGQIRYEYICVDVWVFQAERGEQRKVRLLIRRDIVTKKDYKYSLTNLSADEGLDRLAYFQGQRYWIERAFQETKGTCGMAEYQFRTWTAWYHHMAIVLMAHSFLVSERRLNREKVPLLSVVDIEEMLYMLIPLKNPTRRDVAWLIVERHRIRAADIRRRNMRNLLIK